MTLHTRRSRVGRWAALLAAAVSCSDAPVDEETFPARGAITGTVVYAGPLPCTQRGHVLGAAQLLVFSTDLLPPPEGLGTTAVQFGVVTGDALFAAVVGQLPASDPDSDEVRCPAADAPPVTVSAEWAVGPLPAGRFQVRGFYDRDGDFSPILKIHQLPTAGDVGGGAIANLDQALAGQPVRYQEIELGVRGPDGALTIPATGASVQGVAVTLGQVLPLPRPVFHVAGVKDERPTTFTDDAGQVVNAPPLPAPGDARQAVLAQDERFLVPPTSYPAQATRMFLRMTLGAGLPDGEREAGAARPYVLQVQPPYDSLWVSAARGPDGEIAAIPETPAGASVRVASLSPQAIFAKLDERDARGQTAQSRPAVIVQGLVLDQTLPGTAVGNFVKNGVIAPPRPVKQLDVALRPSVICVPEPTDPAAPVYVVTPRFAALNGEAVIDPASVAEQVRRQLGNRPDVRVIEGCLPRGSFQVNLVYGTGQAWTTPNEAGRCVGSEQEQPDGGCAQGVLSRALLPSQAATMQVGGEREAGFCAANFGGAGFVRGVPDVCLRADER